MFINEYHHVQILVLDKIVISVSMCYKGDLEDLFPWPAGFYESVTKKTEHTVPEVSLQLLCFLIEFVDISRLSGAEHHK